VTPWHPIETMPSDRRILGQHCWRADGKSGDLMAVGWMETEEAEGMTVHKLKSWPDYFEPLLSGDKPFDVRVNDRGFKVGDVAVFREWDDKKARYTGRELKRRVTYVLEGVPGGVAPICGVQRGYVVLGLGSPAP
jgi:uncharacterized protein DUF3850